MGYNWYNLTKTYHLDFRMLRIDRSPGKGLGVFACVPITKGSYVTSYPNTPDTSGPGEYTLTVGSRNFTGQPWTGPVPFDVPSDMPVAHLINDVATLRKHDIWPGLDVWCQDVNNYILAQVSTNMIPDGLRFKALRDIEPGEELYFFYGPMYWTNRFYGKAISSVLETLTEAMTSINFPERIKTPEERYRWALTFCSTMPLIVRGFPDFPERKQYTDTLATIQDVLTHKGTPEKMALLSDAVAFSNMVNETVLDKIPMASQEKRSKLSAALKRGKP